jgi:excisionase family DNA binding protein
MMEYCTIRDGAKILKISPPTIYKLIAQGKLGRYTVLGRPALKLTEINRIIRAKKRVVTNGNGHK